VRDGGLRGVSGQAAGRVGLALAAELPLPFACLSRLFPRGAHFLFSAAVPHSRLWESAPHLHLTPAVGGLPPSARPRLLARGAPASCAPSMLSKSSLHACACALRSPGACSLPTVWAEALRVRLTGVVGCHQCVGRPLGWEGVGGGGGGEALHARRRRARLLRYGCAMRSACVYRHMARQRPPPCANCSLQCSVHSLRTSSEAQPAAQGCTSSLAPRTVLRPSAPPRPRAARLAAYYTMSPHCRA
jgi:hypothetical protein